MIQSETIESTSDFVGTRQNPTSGESPANIYAAEYECVFGNEPSFETMKNLWLNIWNRFIDTAMHARSNYISTDGNGPVFLFESSHFEEQVLPFLIDQSGRGHFPGRDVHIFYQISVKTCRISSQAEYEFKKSSFS